MTPRARAQLLIDLLESTPMTKLEKIQQAEVMIREAERGTTIQAAEKAVQWGGHVGGAISRAILYNTTVKYELALRHNRGVR